MNQFTGIGAYVSRLINQPWKRDDANCWHLATRVLRELFGFAPTFPLGVDWHEIAQPRHGALVLMRRPMAEAGEFEHAGVYLDIDDGGVLHTNEPHGVVFDTLSELTTIRRWAPSFFVRGAA